MVRRLLLQRSQSGQIRKTFSQSRCNLREEEDTVGTRKIFDLTMQVYYPHAIVLYTAGLEQLYTFESPEHKIEQNHPRIISMNMEAEPNINDK